MPDQWVEGPTFRVLSVLRDLPVIEAVRDLTDRIGDHAVVVGTDVGQFRARQWRVLQRENLDHPGEFLVVADALALGEIHEVDVGRHDLVLCDIHARIEGTAHRGGVELLPLISFESLNEGEEALDTLGTAVHRHRGDLGVVGQLLLNGHVRGGVDGGVDEPRGGRVLLCSLTFGIAFYRPQLVLRGYQVFVRAYQQTPVTRVGLGRGETVERVAQCTDHCVIFLGGRAGAAGQDEGRRRQGGDGAAEHRRAPAGGIVVFG